MARNSLIALLITLLAMLPAHAARLYKWVDERGNISYQDQPPPEGVGKVEEKYLREGYGGDSGNPAAAEAAAKSPVKLYMVPKCGSCDAVRVYLRKRKTPFTEIDVSERNRQAQEEMVKKFGALTVPTITVGAKVMQGYVESLLEGELDSAGYPKMPVAPEPETAEGTAETAPTESTPAQ